MLEMKELLGVSLKQLSWGSTAQGVGIIIGSLSGGVLCDKFRPRMDIFIFICSLLTAVSTVLLPWSPTLVVFYVLMMTGGLANGVLRTGLYTLIIMFLLKESL